MCWISGLCVDKLSLTDIEKLTPVNIILSTIWSQVCVAATATSVVDHSGANIGKVKYYCLQCSALVLFKLTVVL